MCGIFLYKNNKKSNFSSSIFIDNLAHRGPDANKSININGITIGHTLLTIRDQKENSIQPITSIDDRYIISFNGQIYNTEDLKKKYSIDQNIILDTKIILEICNKIGMDFISELNGMFAIIIYDKLDNKIVAIRDNSGQKPLYFFRKDKDLIICSEIYPILYAINKTEININKFHALRFVSNIEKETIYKGISKILPGQKLEIDLNNEVFNVNYFHQNLDLEHEKSNEELIGNTIQQHLQTNEKILINLSGGIDSNIILYEAIKNRNIDAVSTYFETENKSYNLDFSIAKKICKKYKINLLENIITKNDYINNFIKCFETLEEINGNFNNPTYFLNYKFIKENNYRSVLNGDGGDEIFVGYDWYFLNNTNNYKFYKLFKTFPMLKNKIFNKSIFLKTLFYFKIMERYNSVKNLEYLFNKNYKFGQLSFLLRRADELSNYKKFFFNNISENFEYSNLFHTQLFWLSEEVFNRNDKLSMHHSIESRSPFSDYNLRYNIISRLKDDHFYSNENKLIVRDIYRSKLEKDIFQIKRGWTTPREWIQDSKFKDMIIDILPKKDFFEIKWRLIREKIHSDETFIMNRSLYPLISLAILINKNCNL